MTIYYLYVKTHNKTGLKYLGQTSKNPFEYKGSGVDWLPHLKEFGNDVNTEILLETNNRMERNAAGRYYSRLWNIVNAADNFGNKIWANRIPETGGGSGGDPDKISKKLKGKKKPPRTDEHKENLAKSRVGKLNPKTSLGLKKWYQTKPNRDSAIEKQAESLREWYNENPERSSNKAFKSWKEKFKKNYSKYEKILKLLSEGKSITDIKKTISADYQTIKKLKNGTHPIFNLFEELKEYLNS